MNFIEPFERFWEEKGSSLRIKNPTRTYRNLHDKMAEFTSVEDIDNYVCSVRTRRESTRKIMVKFFDYMRREERIPLKKSVLYDLHFYDHAFERQLEIAKYLHEPKTKQEIMTKFCIEERTLEADLQELEVGLNVLGSTISLKRIETEDDTIKYKSSVHPIFLALNLTEAYAMTKYLPYVMDSSDPNSWIIRDITDRIKAQLSQEAVTKLRLPSDGYRKTSYDYVDDESLAKQRKGILAYLMKSRQRCQFYWNNEEYTGTIQESGHGNYYILLDDNTILDADLKDVEFIADSFEYR